jgi:hypothetical protein
LDLSLSSFWQLTGSYAIKATAGWSVKVNRVVNQRSQSSSNRSEDAADAPALCGQDERYADCQLTVPATTPSCHVRC